MVRVFGRRSSSLAWPLTQTDDSEVELSDTEELQEGYDIQKSGPAINTTTSALQGELALSNDTTTEGTSKTSCDSEGDFSVSSVPSSVYGATSDEVAKLRAFDFLDSGQKKKRRRNYTRTGSDIFNPSLTDLPNISIDKTVSDLNDFLSSLKSTNEEETLQETLEKELRKSVEDKQSDVAGRVRYDGSRTILYNKNEEEDVSEEAAEEDSTPETPKEPSDTIEGSTHHYNELRNMGESLKYQDELEFLQEKSAASIDVNSFTSILLNLALTLKQDSEFLQYVNKHHAIDVCSWCFAIEALNHPVIGLLQAFFLSEINLPREHLPHFFEELVTTLLSNDKLPTKTIFNSKITRLNFMDFLKKTGYQTGTVYALKLCLRYRDLLASKDVSRSIICLVEQGQRQRLLYPLVDHMLSENTFLLQDVVQASSLLSSLILAFPNDCCDEHLIKSLILLSNEPDIIDRATNEEKYKIVNCSLDYVLQNFEFAKEKMDLMILHLGLLLNLADVCDCQMGKPRLELMRDVLFQNTNSEGSEFLNFMIALSFSHLFYRSKALLRYDEKSLLIKVLKTFDCEAYNCNESIQKKICTALNYLL